ncbi:MAG TPA: site-specific integrase [Puia sp.]|jgi:site-specific recombinase XerD
MKSNNTFGVHFVLRSQKAEADGKIPVYARITVNGTRCEVSMKHSIDKKDWNTGKGEAKPKNPELRAFNSYLQEMHGQMHRHYRDLQIEARPLSAAAVKAAFFGIEMEAAISYSLLWVVGQHEARMQKVLKPGTMKNYRATESYLKLFLASRYKVADLPLRDLNYEFISGFETFVRNNSLKENDPCTTNGIMKHLERLKKMVTWAVKNEWIEKNPFLNFRLKFKHTEREFLSEVELAELEGREFENLMLDRVKDLFLFSCYTGLSYVDLMDLRPNQVLTGIDKIKWIKTTRAKTDTPVNVPLLRPAQVILEKFTGEGFALHDTVFPRVSNQEVNRSLKILAEICGIQKYLTFHLARHTFATTVTLMNGVPIETISKMLGHTKISTTMIYAKVTQIKIGRDMNLLQDRLDGNKSATALKAVK